MAIGSSPVQSAVGAANAASVAVNWPGATTAGNTLIAMGYTNGNAGTMTCSGYTKIADIAYSGTAQSLSVWTKIADGTETSVTLGGATVCRLHIAEWAGLAATVTQDGTAGSNAQSSVTVINTGGTTTAFPNTLLIALAGTSTGESGSRSWADGFTTLQDDASSPRLLSGYLVASAAGEYGANGTVGTSTTNSGGLIIAFKGADQTPAANVSITFPTAGTYTWVAPPDVTSVTVELWGGGGTGGPATGNPARAGGGAGGQYAIKAVTVTPGTAYTIVVAAAATAQTSSVVNGNDSTFASTTVVAKGGAGGANATGTSGAGGAGSTTSGVGDTVRKGGDGGAGTAGGNSGGGGGGAGSTGDGNSGSASIQGGTKSLNGGAGGAGVGTVNTNNPGVSYGGGGSGGLATSTTDRAGGNGAGGFAHLTFTTAYAVPGETSSTTSTGFAGGTTYNQTHVVSSPANPILIANIALWQDVAGTGTISGITYGGVALTKMVNKNVTGGAMRSEQWYLVNPTPGSATLAITVSGDTDARKFNAVTVYNAAQAAPEASQTAEAFATPITSSITTIGANALVIDVVSSFGTGALTVGTGQTTLYNNSTTSIGGASSYEYKSTPGSVTMDWTKGASSDTAQTDISIAGFSSSVTTQKTILGKSRITATTLKTILGKADILNTTLKTQLGKSRIVIVTLVTKLGISRITAATLKTQLGKARITAATLLNQLGKSRITATTLTTQLGKSRIVIVTLVTKLGKARITAATFITNLGVARITATTLKTILGKSRITATTLKTILGKGRISAITLLTNLGVARVTAITLLTKLGKARITATTLKTILGKSRITNATNLTQLGKATIGVATTKTQLGKSRVTVTSTMTQTGKANIQAPATNKSGFFHFFD